MQSHDDLPDPRVAELLKAVAEFQAEDHVMTEAEASALSDTANRNTPRIPVKRLPPRRP